MEFAAFRWFFAFSSPDFYALWGDFMRFEFFHLEEQTRETMMSPNHPTEQPERPAAILLPIPLAHVVGNSRSGCSLGPLSAARSLTIDKAGPKF